MNVLNDHCVCVCRLEQTNVKARCKSARARTPLANLAIPFLYVHFFADNVCFEECHKRFTWSLPTNRYRQVGKRSARAASLLFLRAIFMSVASVDRLSLAAQLSEP